MSAWRSGPVRVRVPATSANLGPGFDSLGLALGLYDSLTAMVSEDKGVLIEVEGEGLGEVALDSSHLVARAMALGFAAMDARPTGFVLRCTNVIPHGRGLGSSAAAIIGGLVMARGLHSAGESLLTDHDLLQLALELEPHPDNLAAALFGGFTTAWMSDGIAQFVRRDAHPSIQPIIAVPDFKVPTSEARSALPAMVSRVDASFNIARAALFVQAITTDPRLLLEATADRLHQESRRSMYEPSMDLIDRLRADGLAAVISGAGPTVLVLASADQLDAVRLAAGDNWRVDRQPVAALGAHVDPAKQA
ncbi:MAG: homoserine kinase [Actinomycetota bacterium]|nr:homoserine kinase [Actinomycetota bacterium]MDP2288275.1 homoserine kinase [Actinomycetota bacterium]